LITLPRLDKLLLIYDASARTFPAAYVFELFSDPAKSTMNSIPDFA